MPTTIYSAQVVGLEATPISVEVDIAPGLHLFSIVGLADKEVQESRERIGAAIKNLGALAPHGKPQRVIVNLAPADIKKEGPAFDLPIAIGYLLASGQIAFNPSDAMFLGELGLDGSLRRVSGVLPIALAAKASGISTIYVPEGNGAEAALVEGLMVWEAKTLRDVIEHLAGRTLLKPAARVPFVASRAAPTDAIDFGDIRGQETAKRALMIAAAGGHNLLMTGPPGAGKTILARSLPSILPAPSFEEALEITKIYSVAGMLRRETPFIAHRPFRNPHHTSSHIAVVGGGVYPRPGEITLSHRGVLFLDEFPEFDRRVIESLRQPLEEGTITVARAKGNITFPARFILVAAMNPCPCGNYGNPVTSCTCSPSSVIRYAKKISGPLMDRIDLHIEVPALEYEKLVGGGETTSQEIQTRVEAARRIQRERFQNLAICTNAEMGIREIKTYIPLNDRLNACMRRAHSVYRLSARAHHRILKLARTIADLDSSPKIEERHLMEALSFRPKQEI